MKRNRRKRSSSKIRRKRSQRIVKGYIRTLLKPLLIFLFISLCLGSIYYVFVMSDLFRIQEIELIGQGGFVNEVDLREFLEANYLNESIIFTAGDDIASEVEETFLGAKGVSVAKNYPDSLLIEVEERLPLAILSHQTRTGDYMVDIDGYVLGAVSPDYRDLPHINYKGEIRIGDFVSRDLVKVYYSLIDSLERSSIKASDISFSETSVEFYTDKGVKIVASYSDDYQNSFNVLQDLLHALRVEGKNPSAIDLRYDKVVVSY